MKLTNIPKVAKSVCTLWKLSGLPVYILENQKFINKKSKAFIIPLLLIAVNMIFYLKYRTFRNDIQSYVNFIEFITIYMLDLGLIFSSYLKRKKIETIFSQMLVAEKMLQRFSGGEFPTRVGRNVLIYLSLELVFTIFQVISVTDFSADFSINYFIETACYHTLVIYSYNLNIILFFFLWSLRDFHLSFNKSIKENFSKKVQVVESDFRQIADIYTLLHKVSKEVHKTFERLILLKILKDFIIAVSTAYHATFMMMQLSTVLSYLKMMIETIIYLIAILMSNFGMAFLFEEISKQNIIVMDLLDEILISSRNEFILAYKSVELFDLKLKRQKPTFNVCGLFPLNCTFIYTMIAGMASYMIYLVQFSQVKSKT